MGNQIRAASVQFEHSPGNKQVNLEKIKHFTELAVNDGVQMLVFPECCITGYWFLRNLTKDELLNLAEPVPSGPSVQQIKELSIIHNITIGAGLIEIGEDGKLYNSYIVALPNGGLHCHRKIHAFENEFISSGSEYTVFDTPYNCKIGILICYDNNLFENVRITALKGADIIFAPHQTGGCNTTDAHAMKLVDKSIWENRNIDPASIEEEFRSVKGREWLLRWLPSRAHDNGVFYIFSNGVGVDDDEIRTGNAMLLDPYGRILAETWKAGDDMVIANLDLNLLKNCTGRRWIRTRRPELYTPLATATGLEEDTRKVRFEKNTLDRSGKI